MVKMYRCASLRLVAQRHVAVVKVEKRKYSVAVMHPEKMACRQVEENQAQHSEKDKREVPIHGVSRQMCRERSGLKNALSGLTTGQRLIAL